MSHSYPTQEDELRAKESNAESLKSNEESKFISLFQTIPKSNGPRLERLAKTIANNFNQVMDDARQEPYERQEELMAGMKRLIEQQVNVIEARHALTTKINPSTARKPEDRPLEERQA